MLNNRPTLSKRFKAAAGLAVFLSPLFAFQERALAKDQIPDDPRYTKLAENVKDARKNCILLDRMAETQNRRTDRIKTLFEIIGRTPQGQKMIAEGIDAGVSVCIIPSQDNPDQTSSKLNESYEPASKLVLISESLYADTTIDLTFHELEHFMQHAGGYVAQPVLEDDFNQYLEETLELETDAYVTAMFNTWLLGKKEYVSRTHKDAREYATGQAQLDTEYSAAVQRGKGFQLDSLSNEDAPKADNAYVDAMKLLDRIQRQHPEWIQDGRAHKALYDELKKKNFMRGYYTAKLLKFKISTILDFVALEARDDPAWLEGQATQEIIDFLNNTGIVKDPSVQRKVAEKILSTKKDAIKLAQTNPNGIETGANSRALFDKLDNNGNLTSICQMIMESRESEYTPPSGPVMGRLTGLGTIHFPTDYRTLSLQ